MAVRVNLLPVMVMGIVPLRGAVTVMVLLRRSKVPLVGTSKSVAVRPLMSPPSVELMVSVTLPSARLKRSVGCLVFVRATRLLDASRLSHGLSVCWLTSTLIW